MSSAPWQPRFQSVKLSTLRALGRGAFGEVSLVKASPKDGAATPAAFALKRASLAQLSEAGLQHAQHEAELLQRLGEEHECILQCFDFRVVPGPHAALELLLEFAPLGDLSGRIRKHKESEAGGRGGLPEAEAVSYGCDVAAGLAHIHSLSPKVLHRDVKPANVVLFPTAHTADGAIGAARAKLADFGIAKVLEADGSFAGANTVIGTPHYFSPEICRGENYDERSDAWALGCVIYEMLCLHRPFHQAEGNIAVLALKVMEGRYDKDALVRQAGFYNGLLIFALTGLLTLDPKQRSRAAEVLQPLGQLRATSIGGSAQPAPAVPWWSVDLASLAPQRGSCGGEQLSSEAPTASGPSSCLDSWQGAQEVTMGEDGPTLHPMPEEETVVAALQRTVLPSPKWRRTSELLLAADEVTAAPGLKAAEPPAAVEPQTLNPNEAPEPQMVDPPTLDPNLVRDASASQVLEESFRLSPEPMSEGMAPGVPPSPDADLSFRLTPSPTGEDEESDAAPLGSTGYLGSSAPLGTAPMRTPSPCSTAPFGDTVRLDSRNSTAAFGAAAQESYMAPSRLAWMGMTGLVDMMSEPPPSEGLDSEASVPLGHAPPQQEQGFDTQVPGRNAPGAGQEVPVREGGDQPWGEPRIFLRPLWQPTGTEPPPADVPVVFCFARSEETQQPLHVATPQRAPQGPPRSYQPSVASQAPSQCSSVGGACVLTGRAATLDPARGWLEVELTIENAAVLYAHMRGETPQQQPRELAGIFELTAV